MKYLLSLFLLTCSLFGEITLETFHGEQILPHIKQIRSLCHTIHNESPYLYNGHDSGYDGYLEDFPKLKEAIVTIAYDNQIPIGFVAGMPLSNTKNQYQQILIDHAHDPETFFYVGEFGCKQGYRDRGIEEKLYSNIESYAKACDYSMLCFWEVDDVSLPMQKPPGTLVRDAFWKKVGFSRYPRLHFLVFWTNIYESMESAHLAVYWTKKL